MGYLRVDDIRQLVSWMQLGLRTVGGVGKRWLLLAWVLISLNGLVPVARTVALANMVGAAAGVAGGGIDSPAGDRLVMWAWIFVGILTLNGFVRPLAGATGDRLTRNVDGLLRERVMRAALGPAGTEFLADESVRAVFEQARGAAPVSGVTPGRIAGLLPGVVGSRLQVVGLVAGLIYVDWRLGAVFALLAVKTQDETQKALWRLSAGSGAAAPGLVDYQLELASTPPAAKEVRVFGLSTWILERYRSGMDSHMRGVWANRHDFTPGLLVLLLATVAVDVVALLVLGFGAIDGNVTVAELTFALAAIMSLNPGGALNADDMPMAFAADTIDKIEQGEAALARHKEQAVVGSMPVPEWTRVALDGVSFRYPGSDADVLRGLDLELRVGERTALVGANGAGKSTLVKLLCGLYQPTDGRILLDGGTPLTHLDPTAWRSQLSVLFQNFVRYELSAADNIRYGAPGWSPDDLEEQLVAAAAQTGVRAHIEALPAGWESPLAPNYTNGTALSGGEWQRVALARTLLGVRAGARLLVLDEPTASLDVRGEAELFDLLLQVTSPGAEASEVSTLFVSHRFSTVRQADRIIVLDEGRIIEDGSHDELLGHDGLYARMFRAQADQYGTAASPVESVANADEGDAR